MKPIASNTVEPPYTRCPNSVAPTDSPKRKGYNHSDVDYKRFPCVTGPIRVCFRVNRQVPMMPTRSPTDYGMKLCLKRNNTFFNSSSVGLAFIQWYK